MSKKEDCCGYVLKSGPNKGKKCELKNCKKHAVLESADFKIESETIKYPSSSFDFTKLILNKPSKDVAEFLVSKNKSDEKYNSIKIKWEKEFKAYLSNFFKFIYYDDSETIEFCLSKVEHMKLYKQMMTDSTESAESYESLEWLGDDIFNLALKRYLYYKFKGNLTPKQFTDFAQTYESEGPMVKMAENINLSSWLIMGSPDIIITDKIKSNVVETISAVISFISEAVRIYYIQKHDYKKAAFMPLTLEAVGRFVTRYYDHFGIDTESTKVRSLKAFIVNSIPNTFNLKGTIVFKKDASTKTLIFKPIIKEELADKISNSLDDFSKTDKDIIKTRNLLLSMNSFSNTNEDELSLEIKEKILDKLGLTEEWVEEFNQSAKIDSIPEPNKTLLKSLLKRFQKYEFEFPLSHKEGNTITVILKVITGNEAGNKTISVETLATKTGTGKEKIKNEVVNDYLKSKNLI